MNNITFFKPKIIFQGCLLALCLNGGTHQAMAMDTAIRSAYFQNVVKGKVVSGTDNMPMPGVTVLIKGTTNAATTDIDGNFEIAAAPGAVLVFSSIGFAAQEVTVSNQTNLSISLKEDTKTLEEVVVVGYGTKKKATLTGSIGEINGKDVAKSPAVNISNGLAGRISGVVASNRGGEPGYDDSSITIRGLGTTGNADVLVVVDGIPGQVGGLSRLSAQEIESITVLKDASAAIYGSRAANGVILVTTKKGKKGSKTMVNYSFDQGFSSPTRLPDMADAATYGTIQNEIAYYNRPTLGMNQIYSDNDIQQFRDGSDPLGHPNTDWAKAALKKTSLQSQHNLNVQGGSENTNYFFSLGKLSQEGLYKNGVANYDQFNVRTNIDTNIGKRLKVGVSLSGRKEDRQYPIQSAGNIFRAIYRAYPTVAAIYPNGLPSRGIEGSNPLIDASRTAGINNNPTYVFNGILRASFDFGGGFSTDGFMSSDVSESSTKSFATPFTLYDYDKSTGIYKPFLLGGGAEQQGQLYQEQKSVAQNVYNIKLNFKGKFGEHSIDAFVAYEQSENKASNFNATRRHFPTTALPELSQGGAAGTDASNGGASLNFTRLSYISRVSYDYKEKYLLELQARVDGSSIFPKGDQYGFFPSVSGGYRISKEDWFNKEGFFNDLKVRASWGQLGNDNILPFQYFNNYSFNNRNVIGGNLVSGIDLIKLGNSNVTWEVATKTDIGINASFLKGFTFEGVYFMQDRTKMLQTRNASLPGSTGIVNPYEPDPLKPQNALVPSENIGKMESNGFEATLGYRQNGEFSWGVSGNFTYAKNKVQFIDESPGILDYQRITGRQLGTYLLYQTAGIFRTQQQLDNTPHVPGASLGDLVLVDTNGDGVVNPDDMRRSKYSNIPRMTFGLNLDAAYKSFDVSVLFSGQAQVSQYILTESGTTGNFYSTWADNRWSPSNPNGSYPRVSESSGSSINGGNNKNNFWLQDASFVRLKNVQVGFTLPKDITEKYGIANFRMYLSAFNLFTITKFKDFDPETNSENGQFYPQQKIVNFGFNVQF